MSGAGDLHSKLRAIAGRIPTIQPVCMNEESTKLFLVLPVLNALGYDVTDPAVVQPEYGADFRDDVSERVDYVILRDGEPVIAVECKKVGVDLTSAARVLYSASIRAARNSHEWAPFRIVRRRRKP